MIRWMLLLLSIALMLNSCNKCKLENSYTIHIIRDSALVRITGDAWSGYSANDLRETVFSNMRASFKDPDQVDVVSGLADFRMILDSLTTSSDTWTETVEDPCYGEHSWLYQQLFPPEHYTYTLHEVSITAYARLIDTLRQTVTPYTFFAYHSESLERAEPRDSTDCPQYEIKGDGSPQGALSEVGTSCYNSVRCQIYHDVEGH